MKPTLKMTLIKNPTLQLTAKKLPVLQVSPNKVMNPRFIDPQSVAKTNALNNAKIT
jgi:hypothetical protein